MGQNIGRYLASADRNIRILNFAVPVQLCFDVKGSFHRIQKFVKFVLKIRNNVGIRRFYIDEIRRFQASDHTFPNKCFRGEGFPKRKERKQRKEKMRARTKGRSLQVLYFYEVDSYSISTFFNELVVVLDIGPLNWLVADEIESKIFFTILLTSPIYIKKTRRAFS